MTLEEAQAIAYIVGKADHGCGGCVRDLLDDLGKRFPEFNWKVSFDAMEYDGYDHSALKVERRHVEITAVPGWCTDPGALLEWMKIDFPLDPRTLEDE